MLRKVQKGENVFRKYEYITSKIAQQIKSNYRYITNQSKFENFIILHSLINAIKLLV